MKNTTITIITLIILLVSSLVFALSEKNRNDDLEKKYNKIINDINNLKFSYLSNSLDNSVCKAKHKIILIEGDELKLNPQNCSYTLNFYRTIE